MGHPEVAARMSSSDKVFTICFGISLGVHLLLIIGQLLHIDWLQFSKSRTPIEVVYEYHTAQQELQELQVQLARAKREAAASATPTDPGERTQIRIPDRPALTGDRTILESLPERSSVIDLTNLVDASRGDPVLLSYFSAIREQIQDAANRHAWLSGAAGEGLVYVSFVLASSGLIQGVAVVADRSAPSSLLREASLRIVKTAAPFPPFPPSITEPSKTIVVPLEFMLGGS